ERHLQNFGLIYLGLLQIVRTFWLRIAALQIPRVVAVVVVVVVVVLLATKFQKSRVLDTLAA
ncbi:MAG: hypothetical protein OIF58_08970, partial [Cohaesibacter sp.]|nr:hypothetical protein [Cohaesibacter sp.]